MLKLIIWTVDIFPFVLLPFDHCGHFSLPALRHHWAQTVMHFLFKDFIVLNLWRKSWMGHIVIIMQQMSYMVNFQTNCINVIYDLFDIISCWITGWNKTLRCHWRCIFFFCCCWKCNVTWTWILVVGVADQARMDCGLPWFLFSMCACVNTKMIWAHAQAISNPAG